MGIKISCSEMDQFEYLGDLWVDFREDRWTFGDRRKVVGAFNDAVAMDIILGYVEKWNVKDINGEAVELGDERGIEILDNVEDDVVVWLISAWFSARSRRIAPKKVN
jgi:hypothetical protein